MHDIETLWRRIDEALSRHAPAVLETLSGPAREKDIVALEKELGVAVPEALRRSWAAHDGQNVEYELLSLFGDFPFPSVADVRTAREEARDLAKDLGQLEDKDDFTAWHALVDDGIGVIDGPVKARDYNPLWLPIGSFNGDVWRYLDLDPAPGGNIGQVIEIDPECVSWRVLAPSFEAFLARYAEALEAGEIDWEEGETVSATLFPPGSEGVPEYLHDYAAPELDEVSITPSALSKLAVGERVEADVEVSMIIGQDQWLDVRLEVNGVKERVWACASAKMTKGYKQVTMRATGKATLLRQAGEREFVIENFELRRRAKS